MARRLVKCFRANSSSFQLERTGFDYELLAPELENFAAYPHPYGAIIEQPGNATIRFVGGLEDPSPLGERHHLPEVHAVRSTFRRSWQ